MQNSKQLIVSAATLVLVAVLLVLVLLKNPREAFGSASSIGTNVIPTVLSGGSYPTVLNALEASESLISDGPAWLMATTTESNASSAGTVTGPVYENKGGVTYAYTNVSFSSTSSVPVIIPNPFGAATTSIDSVVCKITTGVTGTNTFDLSTTTGTGGYGSSTPALIYGHSVATGAQDTFVWTPYLTASTTLATGKLFSMDTGLKDGTSPFFLAPSAFVTLRIATATPGTLATPYGGSCSAQFHK